MNDWSPLTTTLNSNFSVEESATDHALEHERELLPVVAAAPPSSDGREVAISGDGPVPS
jgi:hypothetical protein